jgi:hypothetical protein
MELRIYIKQTEVFNTQGQLIYYAVPAGKALNPQNLAATNGTLPAARQWLNFGTFIDVTNEVSDLYQLKLTWSAERDNDGVVVPGAVQTRKSTSGTITFEGEAYKLLKQWLVDDISAPLNSVDVKIEQKGCGWYENYSIKSTDLRWCENAVCNFDITIKQKDEPLNCIRRTMIYDNHQGWFQAQPVNKKHPRFSYCNEQRPNGMMIMLWYVVNIVAGFFFLFAAPIILGVNGIIAVIKAIVWAINQIPGVNVNINLNFIDITTLFDPLGQFFVESAGCGREHPAPLIRDYISNVCSKCGIEVNDKTAPIFFSQQMTIQTSNPNRGNAGVITTNNPHYNACYFHAPVQRGIRRFNSLSVVIPPFTSNQKNSTDFFIPDNKPLLTLDMFLDKLKTVYNAAWTVRPVNGVPHLFFQRKDYFDSTKNAPVYDFTNNSLDRNKITEGVCFEWNGRKAPAYCEGLYILDAADTCGNEAMKHFNQVISFGNIDSNPTFDGILDKKTEFGAAKFRLDGASTDYIYDALQVLANGASIAPIPSFTYQIDRVADYIREFADYALLLTDETCTLPKILIWDPASGYENAKCVRTHYAHSNAGPEPQVNMLYNQSFLNVPLNWSHFFKHKPETFVLGSAANLGSFPPGYYTVRTAFGIAIITKQPAMLVNYPMYFEPGFYDTMWDWFHWIDDPLLNPVLNMDWHVKLELCCDDLKKLKVFNDASAIALAETVKLPTKYYQEGRITEIELSYDTSNPLGQYIQLKGTV